MHFRELCSGNENPVGVMVRIDAESRKPSRWDRLVQRMFRESTILQAPLHGLAVDSIRAKTLPFLSSRAYVVTSGSGALEYARAVHQYASDSRDEEWVRANLAPDAVVYCASEADVVATVRAATSTSPPVHLSARSGGHSYSGHSSRTKGQGGWVVDVSKLEAVQQVDATVMRVGPGVKLHRLNAELWKRRLSFPKGGCRGVAIGGHLLTSAFGRMRTAYGSGLDHVMEFRVVLADSRVVTARRDNEHSELFHCVLGGFPGSYGIVTEYTIRCIRDNDCPPSKEFVRKWSLPELGAKHVQDIIEHLQHINQQQERAGLRDWQVTLLVGVEAPELDALPDLPVLGHVSDWMDVRPDPTKSFVQAILNFTGIDSGTCTSKHYEDTVAPLDRMTTGFIPRNIVGKVVERVLSSRMSFSSNTAVSFYNPKDHRHVVVGHQSDEWLGRATICKISNEMVRRARGGVAFSQQMSFTHYASQWYRNRHLNALTQRGGRVYFADFVYFKRDYAPIVDSLRSFHRSLPWSTVPGGLEIRLQTFMSIDEDEELSNPHKCTLEQLRAWYPVRGELERLRELKRLVDPNFIFDGAGTFPDLAPISTRSISFSEQGRQKRD